MYKFLLPLILGAALFVANPVSAQGKAPIVINFSHVVAENTPKGQGAVLFKQMVETRLAGQVKVVVHANASLFGDADELEALRDNRVQMLAPSLSKFSAYSKQLQLFDLPFLFDDLEALKRFQKRDKSRELLRAMTEQNIYGLAFWNNGMKQLSATRELRLPTDAKGLAFRIQPSKVLDAQFKALGATGVSLPFSETLNALQSGKVQGSENAWSNIASQRLDAVQPFITESNHGTLNYMLVSNTRFWNSIPYKTRVELEAIIEEVTVVVNQQAETLNQTAREQVLAAGKTKLVSLTEQERAAWRSAMQPVWKTYEAEVGADMLRAAQTVNRR